MKNELTSTIFVPFYPQTVDPICDHSKTKLKYEVPLNQATRIDCHVLAEPMDNIRFEWRFNQSYNEYSNGHHSETEMSNEHLEVIKQFETNLTQSHVIFTPRNSRQYGQFLCSAYNSMESRQGKACAIRVVISELPDPVFQCFFDKITQSSFSVHCQAPDSRQGRQSYLLELYQNGEHDKFNLDGGTSDKPQQLTSRHNQSNWSGERSSSDTKADDEEDEDAGEMDENLPSGQQMHHRQQKVLKSQRRSEIPSFELSDLEPDTNYNVLIYTQNSKGRSLPASYQASTLPALGANQADAGKVLLTDRRALTAQASASQRLGAYFKLADHFNGRPMVGVALVVLLSALTLAIVAFFVSRARRRQSGAARRRTHPKRDSLKEANTNKLEPYDPRAPKRVQLSLTPSEQLKGAGSGSDTSRETNTDSTLVGLSSRPASNQHQSVELAPATKLELASCKSNSMRRPQSISGFKGASHLTNQLYMQQSALINSLPQARPSSEVNSSDQHYGYQAQQTPQPSDNEICFDSAEMHHLLQQQQQQQQQLMLECLNDRTHNQSEPVYVITGSGDLATSCASHQPVGILKSSSLWAHQPGNQCLSDCNGQNNGSLTSGTQVSSIDTADSYDRPTTMTATTNNSATLNGAHTFVCDASSPSFVDLRRQEFELEAPLPPVGFLPNSMSIPASLADHYSLQQQRPSQAHQRRGLLADRTGQQDEMEAAYDGLCVPIGEQTDYLLRQRQQYGLLGGHEIETRDPVERRLAALSSMDNPPSSPASCADQCISLQVDQMKRQQQCYMQQNCLHSSPADQPQTSLRRRGSCEVEHLSSMATCGRPKRS